MATSGQTQPEVLKEQMQSVKIDDSSPDVTLRQNTSSASSLPTGPIRRKSILKEKLSKSNPIEIFHKQHPHFADDDLLKEASPSERPASPCTLSVFPKEQHPRVLELVRPMTPTSPSTIDSYLDPVPPCTDQGRRASKTFDTFQLMKDLDDFRP